MTSIWPRLSIQRPSIPLILSNQKRKSHPTNQRGSAQTRQTNDTRHALFTNENGSAQPTPTNESEAFEHHAYHVAAIIITFLLTVAVVIFALIFMEGDTQDLFEHQLEDLRQRYQTDVLPSGSLSYLGIIVYIYQALWAIYNMTLIIRRDTTGYLYIIVPVIPLHVNFTYSAGAALKIAWFFLWDKEYLLVSMIIMICSTVVVTAGFVLSLWHFEKPGSELVKQGKKADLFLSRLFVHNGLAMLSTWLGLQTIIDVSVVVHYDYDMDQQDASSLSLAIMAAFLLIHVLLNLFLDRYMRYVFGVYLVSISAMACILVDNWDPDERNSTISLIIVLAMGLSLIGKIVQVIWKSLRHPEPLMLGLEDKEMTECDECKECKECEAVDGLIDFAPPASKSILRSHTSTIQVLNSDAPCQIITDPVEVLNAPQQEAPQRAPAHPILPVQLQDSHINVLPAHPMEVQSLPSSVSVIPIGFENLLRRPSLVASYPQPGGIITGLHVAMPTIAAMPQQTLRGTPMGILNISQSMAPGSDIGFGYLSGGSVRGDGLGSSSVSRGLGIMTNNGHYGGYAMDTRSNLI